MGSPISVIVCSRDDAKFAAFSANYARLFGSEPYEIVRIPDARSLSEGYNRAVRQSRGELVVFSHDDVEVLSSDIVAKLRSYLDRWDVVGVAGTNRLVSPSWLEAGPPYLFGQVAHSMPQGFSVCIYGAPRPYVDGIQAMDGVFLATRREVVERVPFDEQRFDGFHMYDVDFTFSAFQAGYRLVVANDIRVIHASGGTVDAAFKHYAQVFWNKHRRRLQPKKRRPYNLAAALVQTRKEIMEVTTPDFWQDATG